ncbi:MAG TPA: hypothetical protein VM534_11275, partial [Thermoanaerobaculia bacterium]|nr:hypothetical protein [Thermoanaerobaculia bacterium]
KPSLDQIRERATALRGRLATLAPGGESDPLVPLRHRYLDRQLEALLARARMLSGETLSFDQESAALYDAVAPHHSAAHFDALLAELDRELPGQGAVSERLERFRQSYVIPPDRLSAVFDAAIAGCRERTEAHLELPDEESFTLEYVHDKPWSGYNWYQGNYRSLIQLNVDLPIFIDRAIDLACHEGYPGHHVYNVLLEKNLVRDRGWVELTVYPLFSPQSLIAEGSANYGIEIAFPGEDRLAFERDVLFPLAGLDPSAAARYARIRGLSEKLAYAGNEAARRYLDGAIGAEEAAEWLERYALMSPERARQRVRFFDTYRSYVINYNLGRDLVARWIEAQGGSEQNPEHRWELFEQLLSTPRLPSSLVE